MKEKTMRGASFRALFAPPFLLLLAACAGPNAVASAPTAGSAVPAVDLGGSSRIPHVAGRAGEGEGYGTIQPASTDHASMPGMSHDVGKPMGQPSMPGMDHSAMGHGPNQSTSQQDTSVSPAGTVHGSGIVNSVDPAGHKISLNHNAIPSIGWPAMTMEFAAAPSVDLRTVKPGAHVDFTMQRSGDGMYVIQSVTPAGGGR
ncbi:MAG: copper-binding protein [Reyranella sp.]